MIKDTGHNRLTSRLALTGLMMLLLVPPCWAQVATVTRYRENNHSTISSLTYCGNHKFGRLFGLHAEAKMRRYDVVGEWQQLVIRMGLDIYSKRVRYTIGYAFLENNPSENSGGTKVTPEHRIWQQALISHLVGSLKLNHRYRLEQRMIGNSTTGGFRNGRYENRFRYMIKGNLPLKGTSLDENELFITASEELFVNFGKEVRYNLFDQNRVYAALGYHLGEIGKLEFGFMYQVSEQGTMLQSGTNYLNKIETNYVFQIGLYSDLAFYKAAEK